MHLQSVVNEAVTGLIGSGVVEKAITESIEKVVVATIESCLSRRSDFGTALEERVRAALQLHDDIDIPSYNDAILKIVRAQVEGRTNAIIQQQVADQMEELLQVAPEEITLSELVGAYVDEIRDKRDAGCVCFGEEQITLDVSESDGGFQYIRLDEEANQPHHKCEIRIGLHKGRVFLLTFQDVNVEKQMFAGPFYNFERMLFQMRAAKSKVVFDCDPSEIETSYSLAEV